MLKKKSLRKKPTKKRKTSAAKKPTKKVNIEEWLSEKSEEEAQKALQRAELETKRRELRDGPKLLLTNKEISKLENRKRYIITAAMNNAELDVPFWRSLRRYADTKAAQIIVIPVRYRNPTSIKEYTLSGRGWWWPDEVTPYLCSATIRLHERFWCMGDIRVGATATNPLSGLDYLGKGASTMFGHPQIAMKVVPTPQYDLPKCMMTTGTCSLPNYSSSKAGAKAMFNHCSGATIVETDRSGAFHFRQALADSEGGFYDLDSYYHKSGVKKGIKAEAVVLGDTHVWSADPKVRGATFDNRNSIIKTLKPNKIVHHDLIDAYSISHHHRNDPITQFAKHKSNKSSLRKEMEDVVTYLEETTPARTEVIVVGSNHHDHIRRWVLESDWKRDIENADIYLELAKSMVEHAKLTDQGVKTIDPFGSWVSEKLNANLRKRIVFLAREISYRVKGIELCMHGDAGLNGARGSLKGFSRIGTKVVIGHSHTPGIEKGAFQVGTSTRLLLEYNRNAPSSWLNTHCVIYPNGKRTLINIIDGKWKA